MKGFLCFVTGAALGALGSFIYIQKFVIPEVKENMRKEFDETAQAVQSKQENKDEPVISKEEPVVSSYETRTQSSQKVTVDYSNYSRGSEANKEPKNDISETPVIEPAGEEPYLIDANSFEEYSDYSSNSFVIFSDGVVMDEENEEILDEDPLRVFGRTAMDELKNTDLVYIRDDTKKKDYALERRDYPFDGPTGTYNTGDPDDWRD